MDTKSTLKKGEQIIKVGLESGSEGPEVLSLFVEFAVTYNGVYLQVNDMPMLGKTHEEAVEILKSASSPLLLTLQTPNVDGEPQLIGGPLFLELLVN